MPRFVILEHDHPFLHWDFMLESGDVLRTWRLLQLPQPGHSVAAEAIGDHRRHYLDYEGPVGGNRGQVKRWEDGTFVWVVDSADRVEVQIQGHRWQGTAILQRTLSGEWRLSWSATS